MSEMQRINITLPRKLVDRSRLLIKEGLFSNFSELIRESIKNELLLDSSLITKKAILKKWFAEESGKSFDSADLTQDELIKRIRKTRDKLWDEKHREWFEEMAS